MNSSSSCRLQGRNIENAVHHKVWGMESEAADCMQEHLEAKRPAQSRSMPEGLSQQAIVTQSLQSKWTAMLTQQGPQLPIEELLERGVFGNVSHDTSLMASPVGSGLSVSPLHRSI